MNLSPHPAFDEPEYRVASFWRLEPCDPWERVEQAFLELEGARVELVLEGVRSMRAMGEIGLPSEGLITLEEGVRDVSGQWFPSGPALATISIKTT